MSSQPNNIIKSFQINNSYLPPPPPMQAAPKQKQQEPQMYVCTGEAISQNGSVNQPTISSDIPQDSTSTGNNNCTASVPHISQEPPVVQNTTQFANMHYVSQGMPSDNQQYLRQPELNYDPRRVITLPYQEMPPPQNNTTYIPFIPNTDPKRVLPQIFNNHQNMPHPQPQGTIVLTPVSILDRHMPSGQEYMPNEAYGEQWKYNTTGTVPIRSTLWPYNRPKSPYSKVKIVQAQNAPLQSVAEPAPYIYLLPYNAPPAHLPQAPYLSANHSQQYSQPSPTFMSPQQQPSKFVQVLTQPGIQNREVIYLAPTVASHVQNPPQINYSQYLNETQNIQGDLSIQNIEVHNSPHSIRMWNGNSHPIIRNATEEFVVNNNINEQKAVPTVGFILRYENLPNSNPSTSIPNGTRSTSTQTPTNTYNDNSTQTCNWNPLK